MSHRWVRSHNFFVKYKAAPDSALENSVHFENYAPNGIIIEIDILGYFFKDEKQNQKEDFLVVLTIAPIFFNEVVSVCKELFDEATLEISFRDTHNVKIHLNCDANKYDYLQSKLEVLFKYYNKNNIEIPDDLIKEFQQVFTLLKQKESERDWKAHKHIIPENTYNYIASHFNPELKESRELINMIGKDFSTPKFIDGIVSGQNVNQVSTGGISLGWEIVCNARFLREITNNIDDADDEDDITDLVKVLGAYGARLFERDNGLFHTSAFDIAYLHYDKKILNYLNDFLSSLTTPMPRSRDTIPMIAVSMIIFSEKETAFIFKNNIMIRAKFFKIDELTPEMKAECYELFKKFFKDPQGDQRKVLATFNDSFANAENRFVEMFYLCNDTTAWLAGINLSEAWKSKILPDHGVVHGIYCYLEPELRRYGLSDIFSFSTPSMLKMLYPKNTFAFVYSPTTYQAYLMLGIATKLLHAPKHLSPLMKLLIQEFISNVYKDEDIIVIHKHMTWVIKERYPLVSVDAKPKLYKPPLEKFYDKWIAAGNYPVVGWHASKQSVEQLSKSANRVGFSFSIYAKCRAVLFKNHAEKIMGKPSTCLLPDNCFEDQSYLFWKNGRIRSKL